MRGDAIIVIDGGIKEDATLTKISLERVAKAVAAHKQGLANRIVMSGGGRGLATQPPAMKTEAQAMKEYAIELGISPENILLEEKSKDLLGNAYFSKILYLEPSQWRNVVVITSDYHMPRAEYVFKKILGPDYVMNFFRADRTLSLEEVGRLMIEEKRKFDLARGWLEPIKDGDSAAIKDLLYHWHPAYVEHQRISNAQMNERAKDY